ncbi:DUF397 domain-containing protein [Glycomyces sp. NPDC048151]|uniref:DUF397 domain-containing protein n=1 Tax=Glycomyces sp. NPDC048151 TaxID=3364002 RepID=UPI00371D57E0
MKADQVRTGWRKSSRSNGGSSGNCVAVAVHGGDVAVGDTKSPVADTYAHLRVSAADLGGLISSIKSGEIA